jgi:hypothetical protein
VELLAVALFAEFTEAFQQIVEIASSTLASSKCLPRALTSKVGRQNPDVHDVGGGGARFAIALQ